MKATRVNKMKQKIIGQLGVFSFLILSSCGQNSHMTLDAVTAPTDTTAPTANLSGGVSGVTNTALQTITVTFSEAVVSGSISPGDFNITNGVLSNLSCLPALAPTACTFDVTASGQGAVSVELPAVAVQDAAGNSNDASNVIAWTYDSVGPTVSLAVEVGEPASGSSTNDSSIALTLTSSEALAGLLAGDFTCTNCTVSGISGSGTNWILNIIPSGVGAVNVELAASSVQDAAGNSNALASNNLAWTYNNVAPALTLAPASGAPSSGTITNVSPIAVELSSSSAITGLVSGDIVCTGCTINNFSGSGASYSFDVLPSGQGAFSVNVPASVAQDAATNQNTASNTLNWSYDTSAPSATLAVGSGGAASGSTTNAASIPVTVVMGESVTGLVAGDFTCTNCTLSGFSGSGANYSFNVIPTSSGAVSVQLPATRASDSAGNGNTVSNALNWTFDNTAPTVVLSGAPVSGYANSAQTITATFSESMNVGTLSSADVSVTNGSVSAFSCSGSPTACTFTVTPTANGAVTVAMAASVAQDNAGNNNTAATNISWTHDTTAPTIMSDVAGTDGASFGSTINASSTVNVDITFSEAIQTSSVSGSDFAVTSPGSAATISGASCASSTVCTVTLNVSSVASSGVVSLELSSPSILDLAGNDLSTTTMPTTVTWNFSSFAGDASQFDYCMDVVVDADDNSICVGITHGNLADTHGGNGDIFLMKRNSSGDVIWIKQLGQTYASLGVDLTTSGYDVPYALAVDVSGNLYITGYTTSALGEENSNFSTDLIVAKFNPNGEIVWLKQAGAGSFGSLFFDPRGGDVGRDLTIDSSGSLIIIGDTDAHLIEEERGGSDPFVIKMTTDGDIVWSRQFGSGAFGSSLGVLQQSADNYITLSSVVTDSHDNIYFVGTNSASFSGASGIFQGIDEKQDPFLISMDSSGNFITGRQFDRGDSSGTDNPPCIGWGGDTFKDLVVTSDNRIFVLAEWSVNAGLDGTGNCYGIWPSNEIIEFDLSFNEVSHQIIGFMDSVNNTSFDSWKLLLSKNESNVFVAGNTTISLAEDNSGGCSSPNQDVFLMKLDIQGLGSPLIFGGSAQAGSGFLGLSQPLTTQFDECRSLAEDSSGKLICAGYTHGNLLNTYLGGSGDAMMMLYDPTVFGWTSSPISSCAVYGCMDPGANNYNPSATVDDGSCSYTIYGCMDPGALNYNPSATSDDGSCTY